MIAPLHVLLIARPSEHTGDAHLIEPLRRAGFHPTIDRVDTVEGLSVALAARRWDAIFITDPPEGLSPIDVLAWLERCRASTPLIVFTDDVEAAEHLKEVGVAEIIESTQLHQLGLVLSRARRAANVAEGTSFRTIASRVPIAIHRTGIDGRVLFANDALAHLLGASTPEDVVGRHMQYEFGFPRDAFLAEMQRSGEVTDLLVSWRKADGQSILVRETAWARRDPSGTVTFYEGMIELMPLPEMAAGDGGVMYGDQSSIDEPTPSGRRLEQPTEDSPRTSHYASNSHFAWAAPVRKKETPPEEESPATVDAHEPPLEAPAPSEFDQEEHIATESNCDYSDESVLADADAADPDLEQAPIAPATAEDIPAATIEEVFGEVADDDIEIEFAAEPELEPEPEPQPQQPRVRQFVPPAVSRRMTPVEDADAEPARQVPAPPAAEAPAVAANETPGQQVTEGQAPPVAEASAQPATDDSAPQAAEVPPPAETSAPAPAELTAARKSEAPPTSQGSPVERQGGFDGEPISPFGNRDYLHPRASEFGFAPSDDELWRYGEDEPEAEEVAPAARSHEPDPPPIQETPEPEAAPPAAPVAERPAEPAPPRPAPVAERPAEPAPSPPAPPQAVAPPEPQRPSMLVVEDNLDTRQLLQRVLKPHYRVEMVADARSAIDQMSKRCYDVLLMDIHLGGKETGADVLRVARKLPGYESTTAIAVTAYALPGDRDSLLDAGFNGYVSKPFTVQALLAALEQARAHAEPVH